MVLIIGASIVVVLWLTMMFFTRIDNASTNNKNRKQRVAIIGAGAAGMAAAYSLSRSKSPQFDIDVFDSSFVCGGVATSESWKGQSFNDGVQGGALDTYANVLRLHREFGFSPSKVPIHVSFGVGKWKWTSYQKTPPESMKKLEPEIRSFCKLMDRVYKLGVVFMLIDIRSLLRLLRYSPEFINHYVLALTALFFGTGNQTRRVPALVVARVFCDPQFAIFKLDPKRFLNEAADFFAFADLGKIYSTMQESMAREHDVRFHLGEPVSRVERDTKSGISKIYVNDESVCEVDYIVFACDAPSALKILGKKQASWAEKWTLSGVKLYKDVTYTHTDTDYMHKLFGWEGPESPAMYLVRPYEQDPTRGELGFVLSNYQPQARELSPLFQTIYLNHDQDADDWSLPSLDKTKVVLHKWWLQFAHSQRHFLRVVPFVRKLQSPSHRRTVYCGAWTMVNTHEAATLSGFAAAFRLGASYPFEKEGFAYRQFCEYLTMIHGLKKHEIK